MSQISPPIRILLIGAVALMAAWFTVLKPKEEEVVPATTPAVPVAASGAPGAPAPQTAPGKIAARANQAGTQASNAATARAGEAPATAAAPATASAPVGQPTAPGVASRDAAKNAALPKSVAKAIADRKLLVMLFWNSKAADDRAVRKALRGVDRHKGKVKVHVASIKDVARYAPITRGVNLAQSPTVVIVDRKLRADALVGYYDRVSINQAISDALRAR